MCGRAAQSIASVEAAAAWLGMPPPSGSATRRRRRQGGGSGDGHGGGGEGQRDGDGQTRSVHGRTHSSGEATSNTGEDNDTGLGDIHSGLEGAEPSVEEMENEEEEGSYKKTTQNMAPGHTFYVIRKKDLSIPWSSPSATMATTTMKSKSHKSLSSPTHEEIQDSAAQSTNATSQTSSSTDDDTSNLIIEKKVWGLVTRHGTLNHPLPRGPSKHYSNLMFNARAETAVDKSSFAKLIHGRRSCVVALDGFFEWLGPPSNLPKGLTRGDKKQPYFVRRDDGKPLLIAGLYTSVSTGWDDREEDGETTRTLETFTMFTTNVCKKLSWLHTRMPVMLWNDADALRWLHDPSPQLLRELMEAAVGGDYPAMDWYPVTKRMSNVSYRGTDCLQPVKLEQKRRIESFFGKSVGAGMVGSKKRKAVSSSSAATGGFTKASKGGDDDNDNDNDNDNDDDDEGDQECNHTADPLSSTAPPSSKKIKSFFEGAATGGGKVTKSAGENHNRKGGAGRPASSSSKKEVTEKPIKRGTIQSFFSPKSKKK